MGNIEIKKYIQNKYVIAVVVLLLLTIPVVILLVNTSPTTNTSQAPIKPQTQEGVGALEVHSSVPDAQFIFNNNVYYTPANIQNVPPGAYIITAHNSGYRDESIPVSISDKKTTKVTLTMHELSQEEIVDQEEMTWTPYFDSEAQEEQQKIEVREKRYPLTKSLPEVMGDIMFDYDVAEDGTVEYVVRPLPDKTYNKAAYEEQVEAFITAKGINPSTIQIQWK